MNATNRTKSEASALLESMTVSFVNENAERIKALAAFRKLSKNQMLKLKEEFMASLA